MRSDSATAVKTAVIRTMRPRARDAHAEAWQAVAWHLIVSRPRSRATSGFSLPTGRKVA
jgi:hypothetical protein